MRKTIGKMSNSRGTWGVVKPVTKIKQSDKAYNRNKDKRNLRKAVD